MSKILPSIKGLYVKWQYLQHCYFNKGLPESIYFYTFHKCASTLFSSYVLKNINGLYNVNYASQIYSGSWSPDKKPIFRKRGFIYGPIRISANTIVSAEKILLSQTTTPKFLRDKIAIFFIRDPRDILVSSFYSFGFTHGFSPVEGIKVRQETTRKMVQAKSLDEYVLKSATTQADKFKTLHELVTACERSSILKYEEMIDHFDSFLEKLRGYISIEDKVAREIYRRSRPKTDEDLSAHRRSGQVSGFRNKLKKETINDLNNKLADTLTLFGYEA